MPTTATMTVSLEQNGKTYTATVGSDPRRKGLFVWCVHDPEGLILREAYGSEMPDRDRMCVYLRRVLADLDRSDFDRGA